MDQKLKDDCQTVKFGDIAEHISKRIDPKDTDIGIYVGLEHLDPDNLRIKRHGSPSDVQGQKLLVKKGQIIFGKRRAYQRKIAVANWDCICSAHAMVLKANPINIIPEFLPFFMQSDIFMNRAVAISEGSLSPTIKWKILAEQKFRLPSKSQQSSILPLLVKSQEVVEKAELAFEKSLEAEKVIAASCFSTTNRKIKHEKLSSLADERGLQTGPFGSQLHAREYSKEGTPVLMPKELGYGEIDVNASSRVPPEVADRLSRHRLVEGDFIFGRRGDIGRFGYISESKAGFICGTGCLRFRPRNKNLAEFYNAFFRSDSAVRWLNQNAVGMTMLNLNTEILGELPVPLMNEDEYQKTATIFKQLEQQRDSLKRALKNNRNLMNALINR